MTVKRPAFLSVAEASSDVRTWVFLVFLFLTHLAQIFIGSAFKFIAFDLTQSPSVVSLIGSISAVAFITVGLFSGIVVDAISRRFFVVFHLAFFSLASLAIYLLFGAGYMSIAVLFGFILLHQTSASLRSASTNRIFFDLCGTERLSRWISRRGIAVTASGITASLCLAYFVGEDAFLFVVYAVFLAAAFGLFQVIGYRDDAPKEQFGSPGEAISFVLGRFTDFLQVVRSNRVLFFLFAFSFLKTVCVYWPMSAGALLKFGIDDDTSRRLYLFAIVCMDLVTVASLLALGRKQSFDNRIFVFGCAISGLGILLFSLTDGFYSSIAMLSIMYIGLAISQVSSSYILRMELPEVHRTQGLAFAVVPYYLADIFSGLTFAILLTIFDTPPLLFGAGAVLIVLSGLALPFARPDKTGPR